MFERFTQESRLVVTRAQAESRELRHSWIGPEHLLLAMLSLRQGVAFDVLAEAGMTETAVREAVIAAVGGPGKLLGADDAEALKSLNIDVEQVMSGVEKNLTAAPGESSKRRFLRRDPARIPFTPRAKKVLAESLREAMRLEDRFIGTEHLLLGLLRDGGDLAARILRDQVHDLDDLRRRTLEARPEAA